MQRTARIERKTNETTISLSLNLDGEGKIKVDTGFGMANHMLSLMFFWAGFDLDLSCKGDMDIDAHHTIEDIGICIGKALHSALGDKKGISRTASARVPMDEALADVSIDLSGRPYLIFRGKELLPPLIAGEECDIWREFYRAFSAGAKMNLHITLVYGQNGHHMLESISKGLGLSLRSAVAVNRDTLLSTKGSLD